MKRILSLILLLACLAMLFSCELHTVTDDTKPATTTASQTEAATAANTAVTETVYVTIVNKSGAVVLARAEVEAADLDEDGKVNLYEALKAAHATCPNSGADGFVAVNDPMYGLSMTKLWGEENNGFGYYQNEVSSWALTDEVHTGDRIVAFAYTDTTSWSDRFSYFTPQTETKTEGETVTLTLTALIPDASWNPVPTLVAGATIIVNGSETSFTTDAEGKVTLTLEKGVNVISAKSNDENLILVPPIAEITIQ